MNILPEWNKPGSFSAGRDPLGLQAASVRLYTKLVPGLTNVTNRLRYYSFYCWVIREYEKIHHSTDQTKWRVFIRRAEAIYALSSVISDNSNAGGMAGSDWARKHLDIKGDEAFDFKPWTDAPGKDGQYLKAVRGNFGQFYISSMIDIGMLVSQKLAIPIVTENFGAKLAKSFENACPDGCRLIAEAIDEGTTSYEKCLKIGQQAHPSLLIENSDEHSLLLDFFLGKRNDDATSTTRQSTLWNVLNAVNFGVGRDTQSIRKVLYTHNLGSDHETRFSSANIRLWQAYQANEFAHVALELLLNDCLHEVAMHTVGLPPATIINHVIERAFKDKNLKGLSLEGLAQRDVFKKLSDDVSMADGIVVALGKPNVRPSQKEVYGAILLLLTLWLRWRKDEQVLTALDPQTNYQRTVVAINNLFEKKSDILAKDAIGQVMRHFIISNHLIIAGQKLATSGTFTYRFIVEDGLLEDTRLTEYTYTNPRLGNLLWFAEDAGLIKNDGLTNAGKEFLNAFQPI